MSSLLLFIFSESFGGEFENDVVWFGDSKAELCSIFWPVNWLGDKYAVELFCQTYFESSTSTSTFASTPAIPISTTVCFHKNWTCLAPHFILQLPDYPIFWHCGSSIFWLNFIASVHYCMVLSLFRPLIFNLIIKVFYCLI